MKTLTQHIQESLNQKSVKEVSNEKPVEEDSASFMRVGPAKSILTRETTREDQDKNIN